jgi:hypothetical protein
MNKSSDTTEAFLEAIASYTLPEIITFEYRVYYDPLTKECIYKTINDDPGDYIVVTGEEYEAVDFSPNYFVKDGKIQRKKFDFMYAKLLKLSTSGSKTIKGRNMFLVDDSYAGDTDSWDFART